MRIARLAALAAFAFAASLSAAQQAPPAAAPEGRPAVPASAGAPALPADGDNATKALVDSPRHGEWVDIPLPAPTAAAGDPEGKRPSLRTWVSFPERKDNAPVVLVIHEIFGLTDWVRGVADQLAAEGFIAVAPDLLSGKGPNGGGSDSFQGDAVRNAVRTLDAKEVVERLNAARDYAVALPAATRKSACIGFCWGGSSTWTYATKQPALDAAVVYYGTGPESKEALAAIACPVVGFYGGDDQRVTATVEPTKTLASEADKSFTAHVYEGAGHGFLRQQTGRDGKNAAAAKAAWKETIAFLKGRLETTQK